MSGKQRDPLCAVCSRFDLRHNVFTEWRQPANEKLVIELGTYMEVKAKAPYCPLCNLVAFAINSTNHNSGRYSGQSSRSEIVHDHQTISLQRLPRGILRIENMPVFGIQYIRFVNPSPEKVIYMHGARRISPKFVDLRLINRWRRTCERYHPGACKIAPTYNGRELVSLRYIDVEKNCIVEAPLDSKYVALSYVWGNVETLKLSKQNFRELYRPYSLESLWHKIPKTIRDAIELTRDLRERYLWVDTLCLIQDDERDIAAGLTMMDVVYEQSELTIIAASGSDAECGLPGYTPTEDRKQAIENINDLSLAVTRELSYYMSLADYSQRGWTFQEQYISRKGLIFVDNKVYWNCTYANWGEEISDEYDTVPNNHDDSTLLLAIAFGGDAQDVAAFELLNTCIMYYSLRNLSFEKDAINAVSGLLDRISTRMCCRFLYGMPTAAFDLALLFVRGNNVVLKRRKQFPSWSWAGWKGLIDSFYDLHWQPDLGTGIDIELMINNWLADCTWIIWYKRSSSSFVSPVWDPAANESFDPLSQTPGYRQRRPFTPSAGLNISCSRTTPTEKSTELCAQPHPYHLLQFWTVTTVMKCAAHCIVDKFGQKCGTIDWDGFPEGQAPRKIKLAVLSESMPSRSRSFDMDSFYQNSKIYWVMALVSVKGGYMERRGIGGMCSGALEWSDEPARWEEVLLG